MVFRIFLLVSILNYTVNNIFVFNSGGGGSGGRDGGGRDRPRPY